MPYAPPCVMESPTGSTFTRCFAAPKVLRPHLRVVAVRARRGEHGGQRGLVHVERSGVPRHQQEAALRVLRVLGRERDLRAGRERGRREKAEGELRRIVGEPARRAHVERGEVEAAHVVERRRAVHQKAGGGERNRVPTDVRERGGRALRHEDRRIGEARRRRPVLLPVADGVERRIRRARPDVVRDDGAVGRGTVVLQPELDLDGGVGRSGNVRRVAGFRTVNKRPVERLATFNRRGVGERPHADGAIAGGRVAPGVVGEEDFAGQHAVRFSELPHQLEAAVAGRAGRRERVVEAESIAPRFCDHVVAGAVGAAVVDGVELDVALHRVVVRGDLPDAAEVAPHVELRDGLLLALGVGDGQRHVRPRGTGRVHIDPQRLEGARVLAHNARETATRQRVQRLDVKPIRPVGIGGIPLDDLRPVSRPRLGIGRVHADNAVQTLSARIDKAHQRQLACADEPRPCGEALLPQAWPERLLWTAQVT